MLDRKMTIFGSSHASASGEMKGLMVRLGVSPEDTFGTSIIGALSALEF